MVIMNQIGIDTIEGTSERIRCNSQIYKRINKAAYLCALATFLRNFPLDCFDDNERMWFIGVMNQACSMEFDAFENIEME